MGSRDPVEEQIANILRLVGARQGGTGTCLEVGCGDGRMTRQLAGRWDTVLALDVSPEMLRRATADAPANVRYQLVSGVDLDDVPDSCADQLICYGVLQHFPHTGLIGDYMKEFARVLASSGEAVVHLPLLRADLAARLWRSGRRLAIAIRSNGRRDFSAGIAYMGARLTEGELSAMVRDAGLRVAAQAELESYFGRARNVILRLTPDL